MKDADEPIAKVDAARLRQIYSSSELAQRVLDEFAKRMRRSSETTVDATATQLMRSGLEVARTDLVELFKQLAHAGCGDFKIGRRGAKSRIVWKEDLMTVGRMAAGGARPSDEAPYLRHSVSASTNHSAEGLIPYPFPLRDDLTVALALPKDLTQAEATRLGEFLKAIARPGATGGDR